MMQRDSRSWYSFNIWTSQLIRDRIPRDFELDINNSRFCGRFRYCKALLDLHHDFDPTKFCTMLHQKLFEDSVNFTPWEHEIPEDFKADTDSKIFNYIDSMNRDDRNKNVDKLLITAAFGAFKTNRDTDREYYNDDGDGGIDEEIGFVPATKSSIEALEKVSDLGFEFECVVCFGDEKKQAKRMPCGHVFHDRCIEEWLGKSHLCPLCRYAMPTDYLCH